MEYFAIQIPQLDSICRESCKDNMKYLGQRPLSSHHGTLPRQKYLYETKIAGVGSLGPNRDLFQERQELSGIAGTTYEPYKRHNHHRTQHCTLDSEGVIRVEPHKKGIEGRPLYHDPKDGWEASKAEDERLGWSRRPTSAPSGSKPNWIARDKQILTFDCYYTENVEGCQDETTRTR